MYRRGGQLLLEPVTCRLVLERRNGYHVNAFRQRRAVPRHMISASCNYHGRGHSQAQDSRPFHDSISASFTAFAAGNRILSAAPQNHQAPGRAGSSSGFARCATFSPATLTLLGPASPSAGITKPASSHAATTCSSFVPRTNSAHAANVVP